MSGIRRICIALVLVLVGFAVLHLMVSKGMEVPSPAAAATVYTNSEFANPQRVVISGYDGSAEQPFISADGQYLFFDDRSHGVAHPRIYYAQKASDTNFIYRGEVQGVNLPSATSYEVSLDDSGNFYFVSDRSYNRGDYNTVYHGVWNNNGTVTGVAPVLGVSDNQFGMVDIDARISYDGNLLYVDTSDMRRPDRNGDPAFFIRKLAQKTGNGNFALLGGSDPRWLRYQGDFKSAYDALSDMPLVSAPSFTRDGLQAFIGAANPSIGWDRLYVVKRSTTSDPFGVPQLIGGDGFVPGAFVEGAFSRDGIRLYYHKQLPDRRTFGIFLMTRTTSP